MSVGSSTHIRVLGNNIVCVCAEKSSTFLCFVCSKMVTPPYSEVLATPLFLVLILVSSRVVDTSFFSERGSGIHYQHHFVLQTHYHRSDPVWRSTRLSRPIPLRLLPSPMGLTFPAWPGSIIRFGFNTCPMDHDIGAIEADWLIYCMKTNDISRCTSRQQEWKAYLQPQRQREWIEDLHFITKQSLNELWGKFKNICHLFSMSNNAFKYSDQRFPIAYVQCITNILLMQFSS